MFDPNKKLSKEDVDELVRDIKNESKKISNQQIKAILEQESFYSSAFKEEKEKNKPEKLSYEEELLLKHSLPIAFFLYVLRALGYAFLISLAIILLVCVAIFWYGYIPHSINMFLFEKFPHIFVAGLDIDYYFDNGILILINSWIAKDMLLFFLYRNLTVNLDRVNKIKEENKELFDD